MTLVLPDSVAELETDVPLPCRAYLAVSTGRRCPAAAEFAVRVSCPVHGEWASTICAPHERVVAQGRMPCAGCSPEILPVTLVRSQRLTARQSAT